ncbi:MAG: stage II sporulation protein M [Robiginitomaculum sp.]|nr:stage II sporulation protein M [Robiginitomaculum sp.]
MSKIQESPSIDLRSLQFRREREKDWKLLQELIERVEKNGAKSLDDDELIALPVLYRTTLSSLSMARAISLDLDLVQYLESLTTRAYFFVYGTRSSFMQRISGFFADDWPRAVQKLGAETLVSFLAVFLSAVCAYVLVINDPNWFSAFMTADLSDGRNPEASVEFLRDGLYSGSLRDGLSSFATFLFTHNSRVAILAFALGFAFGLPTLFLLVTNGFMLGAFIAVYVPKGLGFEMGGWLFIHGSTELFAIILAGAAGFHIGWKITFPEDLSRLQSATEAGRTAATVVIGVVIMLFIAGLIEGFGRQLIKIDLIRYIIAILMLAMWLAYFYLPRKPEHQK